MRYSGAWQRIIALLALIVLVMPASARVASCLDHASEKFCCMKRSTTVVKVNPPSISNDCCHQTPILSASMVGLSEGKQSCHCKLNSIPSQPANDLTFNLTVEAPEATVLHPEPLSKPIVVASTQSKTLFFGDSSPPKEPHSSATHGRAPPVSVQ
jgi:hypothetical protein